MQDLTQQFIGIAKLVPTSQEGGNMVQKNLSEAAMTAPGSQPASPNPGPYIPLDLGPDSEKPQMPVSHPGNKPRVPAGTSPGGQWADINKAPGVLWKQTK